MELIQIEEKIKILELCNDQGFLTDKDKTLLTELTYVVNQLSLHIVIPSACGYSVSGMDTNMNCNNCGEPKMMH